LSGEHPSAQDHRDWAAENERFYRELGGQQCQWPQWALPALFYSALHEVHAFLLGYGIRPISHREIASVLHRNGQTLGRLNGAYGRLERMSRAARYQCLRPSIQQLERAERDLVTVREEIAANTGHNLIIPPDARRI